MKAALQIQDGPRAGDSVALSTLGSFSIGRHSQSDLPIQDKAVSREHCRIDCDGEFFWLVDRDSHNGTLVNGQRISKCMLYDGDVITVGHTRLVFNVDRQDERKAAEYAL